MKPYITLLFLLCSTSLLAQNYKCVNPNKIQYFTNSDHYLRCIRIDSTKTVAGNQILYPYKTARGEYGGLHQKKLSRKGSWLGEKIEIKQDGTHLFYNYWNDTVIIKTQANLFDSWTMYDDTSSVHFVATISRLDTQTILGAVDTVKTITITVRNSTGYITGHPLHNKEILLSQNNGFVQVVDLYIFPVFQSQSSLNNYDYFTHIAGDPFFRLIDFYNPTLKEVHNYKVGDVFQHKAYFFTTSQYESFVLNTITAINKPNNSTVEYSIQQKIAGYKSSLPYGIEVKTTNTKITASDSDILFNLTILPEEFGSQASIIYNPNDTTFCKVDKAYTISSNYVFITSDTTAEVNTFEPCGFSDSYKIGFGKTYYGYCYDPSGPNPSSQLIYTKKNGIDCRKRNFLSTKNITSIENTLSVYPNPANQQFVINVDTDKEYSFRLLSITGKKIIQRTSVKGNQTISTTQIPSGIYLLKLTDETGNSNTQRVVVQH